MGRIKTALELAMEKMESIQVDEEKIRRQAMMDEARSIAGSYISDDHMTDDNLELRLSKFKGAALNLVSRTINEIILQNITLPSAIEFKTRNARLSGLFSVVNDGNQAAIKLLGQIMDVESQYWESMTGLLDNLKEQYKDALAQSSMAPEQNKDFMNLYQQNITQINKQFGSLLSNAKSKLSVMVGIEA